MSNDEVQTDFLQILRANLHMGCIARLYFRGGRASVTKRGRCPRRYNERGARVYRTAEGLQDAELQDGRRPTV